MLAMGEVSLVEKSATQAIDLAENKKGEPSLVITSTPSDLSVLSFCEANSKPTETRSYPPMKDVSTPLSSRMSEITDNIPETSRLRINSFLNATTSSFSRLAAKLDVPADLLVPSKTARLSSMTSSAV